MTTATHGDEMIGNQYKMLWCEVIARAVCDCNCGNKQALRFFTHPETYHEICGLLKLSNIVIRRIRVESIFSHGKKTVSKYSLLDVSKSANRWTEGENDVNSL